MAIIRSQSVSNSSPAGTGCLLLCCPYQPPTAAVTVKSNTWSVCLEKKSKKDESKVSNVKEKNSDEEKKKGKPKAHAPSHAKIRSIGKFSLGRRARAQEHVKRPLYSKLRCVL